MTEHQQELFEKVKQIDDPDILNLLADGASTGFTVSWVVHTASQAKCR